jgi:hypothetical protein
VHYESLYSLREVVKSFFEIPHLTSAVSVVVYLLCEGSTYKFRLVALYSNNDNKEGRSSDRFTLGQSTVPGRQQKPRGTVTIVELQPLENGSMAVRWQVSEKLLPLGFTAKKSCGFQTVCYISVPRVLFTVFIFRPLYLYQ